MVFVWTVAERSPPAADVRCVTRSSGIRPGDGSGEGAGDGPPPPASPGSLPGFLLRLRLRVLLRLRSDRRLLLPVFGDTLRLQSRSSGMAEADAEASLARCSPPPPVGAILAMWASVAVVVSSAFQLQFNSNKGHSTHTFDRETRTLLASSRAARRRWRARVHELFVKLVYSVLANFCGLSATGSPRRSGHLGKTKCVLGQHLARGATDIRSCGNARAGVTPCYRLAVKLLTLSGI